MVKERAIFAAGCFWGVQYYFDQIPGVLETVVGYIGGNVDNPSYEMVCTHTTGHAEAVQVIYDPAIVSFKTLLKHFFRMHNPTELNRQGPDLGDNYRSAIFFLNDAQQATAKSAVDELGKSGMFKDPIVTTLEPATHFWPAEAYHQKYTAKTGRGICHVAYAPV